MIKWTKAGIEEYLAGLLGLLCVAVCMLMGFRQ